MKLNRKDVQAVMLTVEEMLKVNIICQPRLYEIQPIQADEVIRRICKECISTPASVYLAMHYAARCDMLDVVWNVRGNGLTIIKEILPAGYDYLDRLSAKK